MVSAGELPQNPSNSVLDGMCKGRGCPYTCTQLDTRGLPLSHKFSNKLTIPQRNGKALDGSCPCQK
eukprot:364407-Chlamydomonas_euryale.AAC.6